ncbi:hypothetical protein AMTR_s00034p00131640 [Amborella trichopoda]|uniref:DUF1685 domain-containing protein n=1 Tax=Amborella trichopoda TaxID=13333 RepID=W1PQ96_AMBTC|nr:hypothetical protein AMTR_s00034p00131640 [Amborella trichopoda]
MGEYQTLTTLMDTNWFQQNILVHRSSSTSLSKIIGDSISKIDGDSTEMQLKVPLLTTEIDECPPLPNLRRPQLLNLEEPPREPELAVVESTQLKLRRTASRLDSGKPQQRRSRLKNSKSLSELEIDELKGFMDLGFVFNKEDLSPRTMSVIPGLQRLGEEEKYREEEEEEEAENEQVRRPYLSEAWLIRRPDSPLLNLRMPPPTAAGTEMKRHLRSWARTVASVIHQES